MIVKEVQSVGHSNVTVPLGLTQGGGSANIVTLEVSE
jgi:hypothetical protein